MKRHVPDIEEGLDSTDSEAEASQAIPTSAIPCPTAISPGHRPPLMIPPAGLHTSHSLCFDTTSPKRRPRSPRSITPPAVGQRVTSAMPPPVSMSPPITAALREDNEAACLPPVRPLTAAQEVANMTADAGLDTFAEE